MNVHVQCETVEETYPLHFHKNLSYNLKFMYDNESGSNGHTQRTSSPHFDDKLLGPQGTTLVEDYVRGIWFSLRLASS